MVDILELKNKNKLEVCSLDNLIKQLSELKESCGTGEIEVSFGFFQEEGEQKSYTPNGYEIYSDEDGNEMAIIYLE